MATTLRLNRLGLLLSLWATLVFFAGSSALAQSYGGCKYVVNRGDTLNRIAIRFGVSLYALADANGITNINLIFAGQVLTIPVASCGYPGAPAAPNATAVPPAGVSGDAQVYTIQYGDSLGTIAQRFGVSVYAIVRANNITAYGAIFVGQQLLIPRGYGGYYPTQPVNPLVPTATPAGPALPANCGPGNHQVNCWPTFGGAYDQNSIRTEPIITEWETCVPETVDGLRVCSKTGLGYFALTAPALPPGWSLSANVLFTTEPDLASVQANGAFPGIAAYVRALGFSTLIVFTGSTSDIVPI
jgi:LysM repeat protein